MWSNIYVVMSFSANVKNGGERVCAPLTIGTQSSRKRMCLWASLARAMMIFSALDMS